MLNKKNILQSYKFVYFIAKNVLNIDQFWNDRVPSSNISNLGKNFDNIFQYYTTVPVQICPSLLFRSGCFYCRNNAQFDPPADVLDRDNCRIHWGVGLRNNRVHPGCFFLEAWKVSANFVFQSCKLFSMLSCIAFIVFDKNDDMRVQNPDVAAVLSTL